MKKVVGVTAAALMTMTALAGCGGGGSSSASSYCGDIKAASAQLGGLGGSQALAGTDFTNIIAAVQKVGAEAPDDIKPSWLIITNEFDSLQKAIAAAGLTMDDFSKLAQGQTPAGVDPAKLHTLETTLQGFDTSGLNAASNKIQAEVQKDCKIDLNSSSN